jgi:hypothetical protein
VQRFEAPVVAAATPLEFRLTVTDGAAATVTDDISVVVEPSPFDVIAGGAWVVPPLGQVRLHGPVRGGKAPLAYAWSQSAGPAAILANPTDRNPLVTAPDVAAETLLEFSVTVTDATAAVATGTVGVRVLPFASLVASATGTVSGRAGEWVGVPGDASGGRGPYRFAWSIQSGPLLSFSAIDVARPVVALPLVAEDGTSVLRLTVTDADDKASVATVTVATRGLSVPGGPEGRGDRFRPLTARERQQLSCVGADCALGGRSVVCSDAAPFGFVQIASNAARASSSRQSVVRGCASHDTCLRAYWQGSRADAVCTAALSALDPALIVNAATATVCSFCCRGDGCTVPPLPVPGTLVDCSDQDTCYPKY